MKIKLFFLVVNIILFQPLVLEAQLSPGALAEAHAHLSGMTNCLSCHTWGSKDLSPKCLECHTPIQSRVSEGLGYHAHLKEQDCTRCHSDHMDRDFEMIHWEPSQEKFDHSTTGYKLEGKHSSLKCADCHKSELIKAEDVLKYAQTQKTRHVLSTTFLGLGTSCDACHADVHANEFKEQVCQDCHNQTDWKVARATYDHDLRTNFPLRGAHKKVDCAKCHKDVQETVGKFQVHQFSGLKFDVCTNCHEDHHKGAFGSNCLKCHTENTFKQQELSGAFDHQATRYPLVGKHAIVPCEKCHTAKDRFKPASSFDQCSDCHADYHKGVFQKPERETTCEQCHHVRGFFPALFGVKAHAKTNFPLDGAHLAQPCIFCHKKNDQPVYHWNKLNCVSCHESVHGEQFKRYDQDDQWCESCHVSAAWSTLLFDHKNTQFPLTGKHSTLKCADCHKPVQEVVAYENTPLSCVKCHDDKHSSQFKKRECKDCHGTDNWKIPQFKHDLLTEFPLDGQHDKLACGQCHKYEPELNTIRFKPIAHACQDCHSFKDFRE